MDLLNDHGSNVIYQSVHITFFNIFYILLHHLKLNPLNPNETSSPTFFVSQCLKKSKIEGTKERSKTHCYVLMQRGNIYLCYRDSRLLYILTREWVLPRHSLVKILVFALFTSFWCKLGGKGFKNRRKTAENTGWQAVAKSTPC